MNYEKLQNKYAVIDIECVPPQDRKAVDDALEILRNYCVVNLCANVEMIGIAGRHFPPSEGHPEVSADLPQTCPPGNFSVSAHPEATLHAHTPNPQEQLEAEASRNTAEQAQRDVELEAHCLQKEIEYLREVRTENSKTISELETCRDHWRVSFGHERENVIRLRGEVYNLHNSLRYKCECPDCLLVRQSNAGATPDVMSHKEVYDEAMKSLPVVSFQHKLEEDIEAMKRVMSKDAQTIKLLQEKVDSALAENKTLEDMVHAADERYLIAKGWNKILEAQNRQAPQ
jgi:hypothetical protein